MKNKKIRVELEMSPDRFKELIEAITDGRKVISEAELDSLAKAGEVKAADYLNAKEVAVLAGWLGSFKSKIKAGFTSDKLATAIKAGITVGIVKTISVERDIPPDEEDDLPKE